MNSSSTESTNIGVVRIAQIERAAAFFLRYGLVVAIGWIAAMKATDYEAKGIQPLIAHSPLIGWGYSIWTVDHFTMIIGAIELIIVGLIAILPGFPKHLLLGAWAPSACSLQPCHSSLPHPGGNRASADFLLFPAV
jgi:uncharacterized membrane protein YkgB